MIERTTTPRFGFSAWQWLIIVLGWLLLCGCRAVRPTVDSEPSIATRGGPHDRAPLPLSGMEPRRLPPTTHTVSATGDISPTSHVATTGHEIPAVTASGNAGVHLAIADSETVPTNGAEAFNPGSVRPSLGSAAHSGSSFIAGHAPPVSASPAAAIAPPYSTPHAQLPLQAWGGEPGPWLPEDEYIVDGGDRRAQAHINAEGTLRGLEPQDTIAHFATPSGQTQVVTSNPVLVYAPRFAAIRQVSGILLSEASQEAGDVIQPSRLVSQERREGSDYVSQPVQTERNTGTELLYAFRRRELPLGLHDSRFLHGVAVEVQAYENFKVVRTGTTDNSEKARLAAAVLAAKSWTHDAALQVILDGAVAVEAAGGNSAEETVRFEMPKGKPKLRLIKLASRQDALPGDTVDFTLRFDNLGDEVLNKVTILDHLTARLEYVPDSAQSTVDAQFSTTQTDDGTIVLRWDLAQPLPVGQGGVVKFRCRVR
jgi:uncharacterized repeat protein (TIGR01451 family)